VKHEAAGTKIAFLDVAREMSSAEPGMEGHTSQHALHITLLDGFRGHVVVIDVDGHEVYRRDGVTTHPTIARADAFQVAAASRVAHVAVFVTPGDYVGSLDVDVARHPHLAISLVGEGTVSFETSAHRFT
jgi:hypothetical protein